MPDKQDPPVPPDDTGGAPQGPPNEWNGGAPTRASFINLTARVAEADLRLCEMQAYMDELIDANDRLRSELGVMTLHWIIEATRRSPPDADPC